MHARPIHESFKSPELFKAKCEGYFMECDNTSQPYTITGLALYLNCSKMTINNYEKERNNYLEKLNVDTGEYAEVVEWARLKCENYAEKRLYGDKQVQGAIFNLKNNYGWQEKQEFEHSGGLNIQIVKYGEEEDGD